MVQGRGDEDVPLCQTRVRDGGAVSRGCPHATAALLHHDCEDEAGVDFRGLTRGEDGVVEVCGFGVGVVVHLPGRVAEHGRFEAAEHAFEVSCPVGLGGPGGVNCAVSGIGVVQCR